MEFINRFKVIDIYNTGGVLTSQILRFSDDNINFHLFKVKKLNGQEVLLMIDNVTTKPVVLTKTLYKDIVLDMADINSSLDYIQEDNIFLHHDKVPTISELASILDKKSIELIEEIYTDYTLRF